MASRPIKSRTYHCVECTDEFHPHHVTQACCSYSCAARRRNRKPGAAWRETLKKAHALQRTKYAKRLGEKIRGLTASQAWREAYRVGWHACYTKLLREGRIATTRKLIA